MYNFFSIFWIEKCNNNNNNNSGNDIIIRLLGLEGRVYKEQNQSFLYNKKMRFKLLSFTITAEKIKNKQSHHSKVGGSSKCILIRQIQKHHQHCLCFPSHSSYLITLAVPDNGTLLVLHKYVFILCSVSASLQFKANLSHVSKSWFIMLPEEKTLFSDLLP